MDLLHDNSTEEYIRNLTERSAQQGTPTQTSTSREKKMSHFNSLKASCTAKSQQAAQLPELLPCTVYFYKVHLSLCYSSRFSSLQRHFKAQKSLGIRHLAAGGKLLSTVSLLLSRICCTLAASPSVWLLWGLSWMLDRKMQKPSGGHDERKKWATQNWLPPSNSSQLGWGEFC